MGADGHIEVFDWMKVKEKFPDAGEKITSSLGYIQQMKTPGGEQFEVFSGYYGYNIYIFIGMMLETALDVASLKNIRLDVLKL